MIQYHPGLIQGSDEWLAARCGLLTASEMNLILTPTLKIASNDKECSHMYELLGQRITRFVEPRYIGDDMLRGMEDEVTARFLYSEHYALVTEMGFITNDKWGFTIGGSPDGLVGNDGMIECKSRRQKFQIETIIGYEEAPIDYMLQIQTLLLVTERNWCDFISYAGGLHMITIRVYPDVLMQAAIVNAATAFEERLAAKMKQYEYALEKAPRMIPTERRVELEMHI